MGLSGGNDTVLGLIRRIVIENLTGQNDAPKLADPSYRSQTAAAISCGIMQYLQVGNSQAITP